MSVSLLSYGALTFEAAYRAAGQWDIAVRNLDWAASYIAKCHTQASDTPAYNKFVAQVRANVRAWLGLWVGVQGGYLGAWSLTRGRSSISVRIARSCMRARTHLTWLPSIDRRALQLSRVCRRLPANEVSSS